MRWSGAVCPNAQYKYVNFGASIRSVAIIVNEYPIYSPADVYNILIHEIIIKFKLKPYSAIIIVSCYSGCTAHAVIYRVMMCVKSVYNIFSFSNVSRVGR